MFNLENHIENIELVKIGIWGFEVGHSEITRPQQPKFLYCSNGLMFDDGDDN